MPDELQPRPPVEGSALELPQGDGVPLTPSSTTLEGTTGQGTKSLAAAPGAAPPVDAFRSSATAREPFDGMPLPEADLELMILGDFYRTLRFGIDRMAPDVLGLVARGKLDWSSGFVTSSNDLLKPGQITHRGPKLLKHSYLCPWDLAAIHILRSCDTCSDCTHGKQARCENGPRLKHLPTESWTDDEAQDHAFLEQRIQALFRRWARAPFNFIVRKPPIIVRAEDEQIDDEDDAWACRITDLGMIHAQEVFAKNPEFKHGGPWSNLKDRRLSPLWCRTDEQRRRAPQWLQKEFQDEGGKLSGAPIEAEPTNFAVLCDHCRNYHVPAAPCPPPRPAFLPPVTAAEIKRQLGEKKKGWLDWLKRRGK